MPFDSVQPELPTERILQLLREGELADVHGLLPWSSNYTFLMRVQDAEHNALAIYKPRRGERPLWDFPDGTLCKREVAAFLVSEALGWHIVPATVLRDGPHGIGMAQFFIPHDPEENYFTFDGDVRPQLARIALFDHLANNADRKGGHCLLGKKGFVWAIDHGICFHVQPKLRTVIWDFAGERIAENLVDDLRGLAGRFDLLERQLKPYLSAHEIEALCARLGHLAETGKYPQPGPGRNYPWPPV